MSARVQAPAIPDLENKVIAGHAADYLGALRDVARAMDLKDSTVLTAEVFGFAIQGLFVHASRTIPREEHRQVIVGLGAGLGRVLGSYDANGSADTLALFLHAAYMAEVEDRRGR